MLEISRRNKVDRPRGKNRLLTQKRLYEYPNLFSPPRTDMNLILKFNFFIEMKDGTRIEIYYPFPNKWNDYYNSATKSHICEYTIVM